MAPLLSYHFTSFKSNKQSKKRIFISLKCEVSVIKRFIFKLNVLIIIKSSKKAQRLLSKGDSIPLPSPAPPLVSAHFTPTRGLRHRGERVMSGRHRGDPAFGRRASHSEGSAEGSDTKVNGGIFCTARMCKILIFKPGKKN